MRTIKQIDLELTATTTNFAMCWIDESQYKAQRAELKAERAAIVLEATTFCM